MNQCQVKPQPLSPKGLPFVNSNLKDKENTQVNFTQTPRTSKLIQENKPNSQGANSAKNEVKFSPFKSCVSCEHSVTF